MSPTYIYGFSDSLLEVVLHEPHGGRIPEALVQDIWLNQRIQNRSLRTVDDVAVDVIHPGHLNTDAGPDFIAARLRIDGVLWNGAVEIHVTSGGWQSHRHDVDERYNSTLLHVVLYHDMWTGRLRRQDGTTLPEVVLQPYLEDPLRRLIHSFYVRTDESILCAGGWSRVPAEVRTGHVTDLAMERMTIKSRKFVATDPDAALYEAVLTGLGYAKNAGSMLTLSRIVALEACRRMIDPIDVEALLLGASGLLPSPSDLLEADRDTADYVMDLRDRFERLNHGLGIVPMPDTAWRFFRLRPANFPPLRIAQAAALLQPGGILHNDTLTQLAAAAATDRPVAALRKLFEVSLSPFWNEHVRLEKKTRDRSPAIGKQRIDALLVNVVLPALLARGHVKASGVRELLENLPGGDDEVTRLFAELGSRAYSSLDVQGFHQLYRTRCSEARCLSCPVGEHVLAASRTNRTKPDAASEPEGHA